MVLFVSDIHFGREDAATERAKERELIACLRAHEHDVEHLYLVGDVFDAFIEYATLVPKGFVRFQGLLAEWTDRGVPVSYLVGNHDPWHLDHFRRELGVRVAAGPLVARHHGRRVHLDHGDGIDPAERRYRMLRPLLRHPLLTGAYRWLLPADAGLRLARRVSRAGDETLQTDKVIALRDHALALLHGGRADLVVMGHAHRAERVDAGGGTYLNLGAWAHERTFATLDREGPTLRRWNGDCTAEVGRPE